MSVSIFVSVLLPRQLPFTGPTKESTALRAWVFLQKSWQFGFLLTLPLCRWHPKNFSKGSWQSFSLKHAFTPEMPKRYGTRSRKEHTRRETTQCNNIMIIFCGTLTNVPHNKSQQQYIISEPFIFKPQNMFLVMSVPIPT